MSNKGVPIPQGDGASEGPCPEKGKEPEAKRPGEESALPEGEVENPVIPMDDLPDFTVPDIRVPPGGGEPRILTDRERRMLDYERRRPDLSQVERLAAGLPPLHPPNEDPLSSLPNIVPLAQVADLFGVDVRTVRRWVRQGRVCCFRTSPRGAGRVLFEKAEVRRLWESMKQPPPGAAGGGA